MKYIKSICLSMMFALFFAVVSVNNANATEISVKSNDSFDYFVDENSQITIKRCKSAEDVISIPDKIDGLDVSKIGEEAFKDCLTVKKVILPNTIKYIGFRAFSNSGIRSLIMPDSLTTIEPEAFKRCKNLKKIYFSNGLKEIPNCVCSECSALEEIYLPKEATILGDYAFSECKNLAKVYFPSTICNKSNDVFSYSNNIKELIVIGCDTDCKEIVESIISRDIVPNVTVSTQGIEEYNNVRKISETKDVTSDGNNGTQEDSNKNVDNKAGELYVPQKTADTATNILIYVSIIIISGSTTYIVRYKAK